MPANTLFQHADIHYQVECKEPHAHRYHVSLFIEKPSEHQVLRLPSWIPGSYMIRDFAKNIVEIHAHNLEDKQPLQIEKQDKNSWIVNTQQQSICVSYIVYAWDLSVRSAHFDQTHAYFNGTSLFLEVLDQAEKACSVELIAPEGEQYADWRVATSLNPVVSRDYTFGTYKASGYDDLIDHPVEMGDFTLATFHACGIQHDVVLVGKHYADMDRLCADLTKICEYQIQFWGEKPPVDYYLFMTLVVDNGYGGLEHRASTSLIANRADMPLKTMGDITEGYRQYLGLCSHEYFHTWNVKRIKPNRFMPYDLNQEVHTELMWFFEGITSYYDNLILAKCGCITEESYLELLGQDITRVHRQNGRFRQTVANSSFDTWTRFYKQDEGAPNHIVSYYAKGALIALALDLTLRDGSDHKQSLDQVMQYLWQRYQQQNVGIDEHEMPSLIQEITGVDVSELLQKALYTTQDLPLAELLSTQGYELNWYNSNKITDTGGKKPSTKDTANDFALGVRAKVNPQGAELVQVFDNMSAQQAGLSAGDVIIAIDQLKVNANNLDDAFKPFSNNDQVICHFFRKDILMSTTIELTEQAYASAYIEKVKKNNDLGWINR